MDANLISVDIVVTCQTKNCFNEKIIIPVTSYIGANVVCGACGETIVDEVKAPEA